MSNETQFPVSGNYFSVVLVNASDRSWRTDVFRCLESDERRVVARMERGSTGIFGDKVFTFFREDCRFDDVTHLLPSLGFAVSETEALGE